MTKAPKTEPTVLADANADEGKKSFTDYVREHPGAFIAGGVVLGVVLGALFPRRAGSAVAKRALALAATAGELSLVAARHAREGAEKATHEAKDLIGRDSAIVRDKAGQLATAARQTGQRVADRASGLASRMKH